MKPPLCRLDQTAGKAHGAGRVEHHDRVLQAVTIDELDLQAVINDYGAV